MKSERYLHSFFPVLPSQNLPQHEINRWILNSHEVSGGERENLSRFCLSESSISKRYFDCEEVDLNWASHRIYHLSPEAPQGARIDERNAFFSERALNVFEKIYRGNFPQELVHVTCTGYVSPSPPQMFFQGKINPPGITHAYHMGCYASLPAIRIASALSSAESCEVDIVHTEMCSLHLDPSAHTAEQMVVQTLFADGHIKYSVGKKHGRSLRILKIKEKLIPDSSRDMTWVPGPYGMKMSLSKAVPLKIRDELPTFIQELCSSQGIELGRVLKEGVFAVHPGGPKIIEAVQKKLELRDDQVEESRKVLFERGNMSSATLPHVWNEIIKSNKESGTIVVSLAFGPGLTIFGGLFEIVE
jgi:predicted naringenin-chalcone synthase